MGIRIALGVPVSRIASDQFVEGHQDIRGYIRIRILVYRDSGSGVGNMDQTQAIGYRTLIYKIPYTVSDGNQLIPVLGPNLYFMKH